MKQVLSRCLAYLPILVSVFGAGCHGNRSSNYSQPPLVLDADSAQLKQTVVVPTLDSSVPPRKNAVWCASFAIAWNQLVADVTKELIHLAGPQAISDRLNAAT